MARPLRIQYPGGIYHVTARGNDRQRIFEDDDDHARFLIVLVSVVARYHVLCHAYCLMSNHYHLLVETPEANLSAAMRQLNGVYTQRFNRRHDRCGHLLQGRFGAQAVARVEHLLEVCRYIVLNPVRAGLVAHPRQWRWSSFGATAGETIAPGFLTLDWLLALGGSRTRGGAVAQYTAFVEAGIDQAEEPLDRFSSKTTAGGENVRAKLGEEWRRVAAMVEIPRAQRFAGRPSLRDLFREVTSKTERNAAAVVAVLEHGYQIREVAAFLGCHYATISRVLTRVTRQGSGRGMSYFKT